MDNECICKGNWRNIVKDSEPLFDKIYLDRDGEECVFFGVIHGADDYYYGMWNIKTGRSSLLSCVGSIEGFGYTLKEEAK
jgi:hypothetical protein